MLKNLLGNFQKILIHISGLKLKLNKQYNSKNYWIERYKKNGRSGVGSYNKLAEFKAQTINDFVKTKKLQSVIEYGCGDGNQLKLASYNEYLGFDISQEAIAICKETFLKDNTKKFKNIDSYNGETAELTLSLDVIYHLLEDDTFKAYMERLFNSSLQYVIIYSSNTSIQKKLQLPHVKHRNFSIWVDKEKPEWELLKHIPNQYPSSGNIKESSFADFYIYKRSKIIE